MTHQEAKNKIQHIINDATAYLEDLVSYPDEQPSDHFLENIIRQAAAVREEYEGDQS